MDRLKGIWKGLRRLLVRGRVEAELEEELAFHLAMETAANERRGMDAATARRAAHVTFGGVERYREEVRRVGPAALILDLAGDIRQGVRRILRQPGHAIAAVLTLGLGIGVSTAIFGVADGVVFRPLAYREPERLVAVWETYPGWRDRPVLRDVWDRIGLAWPDYERWRADPGPFAEVAVYGSGAMALSGAGGAERLHAGFASASLFEVLGVGAQVGRTLLPGEDGAGAANVAVVSHALWQRRWGGDPTVIGRTMRLDGRPYTIVGVLPRTFRFGAGATEPPDVWIPVGAAGESLHEDSHAYGALGRLRQGLGIEAAVEPTAASLRGDRAVGALGARLIPLHEEVTGASRPPLLLLLAAAGLLLLIACVNVAALLLGEASRRESEVATRAALGASRGRILRQFLVETLVLSGLAAVVGVGLAYAGTSGLIALAPADIPRLDEVAVDTRVLGFAALTSLLTGVLCALAPGLSAMRGSAVSAPGGSARHTRQQGMLSQGLLVGLQLTILMVLVTTAALLSGSLLRATRADPGFTTGGLLTAVIELPESRYEERARVAAFHRELIDRLENAPGVRAVSGASVVPFSGDRSTNSVGLEGMAEDAAKPEAAGRVMLPGYTGLLGIPLRAGREVTDAEAAAGARVALVSETMARRFWPAASAVGRRFSLRDMWYEVVGVVADVREGPAVGPEPTFYVPLAGARETERRIRLVVRADGGTAAVGAAIRVAVSGLDADVPVSDLATMESLMAASLASERFRAWLVGLFAGAAIMLAGVGIFGVTLRVVTRRRRELGIRMALGARPRDVLASVLGRTIAGATVGLAVGTALGLAGTPLLAGFLDDATARDPTSYLASAGALLVLALVASWLPARRALRPDVLAVLREE